MLHILYIRYLEKEDSLKQYRIFFLKEAPDKSSPFSVMITCCIISTNSRVIAKRYKYYTSSSKTELEIEGVWLFQNESDLPQMHFTCRMVDLLFLHP